MFCDSSISPIDISNEAVKGKCNIKCIFNFDYHNITSSVATHRGNYISISGFSTNIDDCFYNTSSYIAKEIRIYSPSIHTFNGNKMDAELCIVNNSLIGETPLLVCIPIQQYNVSNNNTQFFQALIDLVSSKAPIEDESVDISSIPISINNFLVSKKPFYTFDAVEPFQPCLTSMHYVVFEPSTHYIEINSNTLATLKELLKATTDNNTTANTKSSIPIYYNNLGANVETPGGASKDQIYIDCQPISNGNNDESDKSYYVSNTSSNTNTNIMSSINIKSPASIIIISTAIFVIVMLCIKYAINYINQIKSN